MEQGLDISNIHMVLDFSTHSMVINLQYGEGMSSIAVLYWKIWYEKENGTLEEGRKVCMNATLHGTSHLNLFRGLFGKTAEQFCPKTEEEDCQEN